MKKIKLNHSRSKARSLGGNIVVLLLLVVLGLA